MTDRSGDVPTHLLDSTLTQRVAQLRIQARRAVDGVLSGAHRSPHRGASHVFQEHRDYRPGDDVRRLDWRAYARTDRDVIKHFEQEIQLQASLILDASGSMAYPDGHTPDNKAAYAATLLAAIALILLKQGDAVGGFRIDHAVREAVPARRRGGHLDTLLTLLAQAPSPGVRTALSPVLARVGERLRRRGLVVLASDLLDADPAALAPLSHLAAKGHEVWVVHVMHADELDFKHPQPTRFEGCEGEDSVEADPSALRSAYQRELRAFIERAQRSCIAVGARYVLARTDEPPEGVLAKLLGRPVTAQGGN